jgi:hypothetical protein
MACAQAKIQKQYFRDCNFSSGFFPDNKNGYGMSSAFKYNQLEEGSDLLDFNSSSPGTIQRSGALSQTITGGLQSSSSLPQGQMNSKQNSKSPVEMQSFNTNGQSSDSSGAGVIVPGFLRNAAHPYVCLFHLVFKGLAIFTYWIIYALTKDIVFTFILTTIFLAADFWTVKNVTGRILVGLRWWNKMNEDGTSEWVFESGVDRSQVSSLDKNVFWIALYVFPIYWAGAAISNVLSFSPNFVILNMMGLAFAGINAMGYTKCSRSGQQAVTDWAKNQAMKVITGNVLQNIGASSQV